MDERDESSELRQSKQALAHAIKELARSRADVRSAQRRGESSEAAVQREKAAQARFSSACGVVGEAMQETERHTAPRVDLDGADDGLSQLLATYCKGT